MKDLLATTRNPYQVARETGKNLSEARKMIREEEGELPGWGRPELYPWIVSRKKASDDWPRMDHEVLKEARRQHDQGRVTMCQGRDGNWIIQYAIPTRRSVRRVPYFNGG